MPNQQGWMFRWIFSICFPRLIPFYILSIIKIIFSDSDPQEYNQIDNAILHHFPFAKRGRCGWHIIAKGFEKHVNRSFPGVSKEVADKHLKLIMN